jgi:hypothetical protein
LLGRREFTRDRGYYIKSRLLKNVKALYGIELPLLDEKGYLAACSKNLAAGCKVSRVLVAQPGRANGDILLGIENENNDKSPRRDLDARPKVFAPTQIGGLRNLRSARLSY